MIYFLFLVTLLLGFLGLAWLLLRFLSSTASRYLYKDELNNCTLSLDLQYVCFGFLHAGPVGVERYRDVVVALLRHGAYPSVRDEEGNTILGLHQGARVGC
jgi:hypothetical protein